MKEPTALMGMATAVAIVLFLPACATQTTENVADTEMERTLVSSGFKVRTASSDVQRNPLGTMSDNRFEVVKQNGNTYYLYVDKRENRLYVGDENAYRSYKAYIRNNKLRKEGAFVWEVHPYDRANNKTIDVWNGYRSSTKWLMEWFSWLGYYSNYVQAKEIWFWDVK